jgi:hypothetical protein
MKRLRDYAQIGSVSDVRANLDDLASKLRQAGQALLTRHDLGAGCRVYPEIGRSTSEQLQLLGKLLEEAIEVTANVCRTVFEINVVFRYCLSSPERLNAYADQAGTDEISIYKSIKGLADEDTDPKNLELLDSHINHIRHVLRKHGRSLKPERTPLYQMAREIGLKDEYDSMYGIYSKYVHASAWFVLRKRNHIDLPMYRLPMQLHTQLYAADTLSRLEDLGSNTQQGGPSNDAPRRA